MRLLTFAALLLVAIPAVGQPGSYSFTVLPDRPIAGTPFRIRVELGNLGCVPLPGELPATFLQGRVIRYELRVPDSCFPFPPQERTYVVPALPVGDYDFQLAVCPQPQPPPQMSTCSTVAEQPVMVVAQSASVANVPLLSQWGLTLLLGGMMLLGLAAVRRT